MHVMVYHLSVWGDDALLLLTKQHFCNIRLKFALLTRRLTKLRQKFPTIKSGWLVIMSPLTITLLWLLILSSFTQYIWSSLSSTLSFHSLHYHLAKCHQILMFALHILKCKYWLQNAHWDKLSHMRHTDADDFQYW